MSFIQVASLAELDDRPLAVTAGDLELVLVKIGDDIYAIANECSHARVELSEGDVDEDECSLECYLHGSRFDLRTGVPLNLPATQPVAIHPVRIDGDDVLVDIDNPISLDAQESCKQKEKH